MSKKLEGNQEDIHPGKWWTLTFMWNGLDFLLPASAQEFGRNSNPPAQEVAHVRLLLFIFRKNS